jgi:hypothetical protein
MKNENPRHGGNVAGAVDLVDQHEDHIALASIFQSRSDNAWSVARGLEAAMRRDRAFFRRHPFLSEYTREIMPGEFSPSIIPVPQGYLLQGFVKVRRISANVRKRIVLAAIIVPEHEWRRHVGS